MEGDECKVDRERRPSLVEAVGQARRNSVHGSMPSFDDSNAMTPKTAKRKLMSMSRKKVYPEKKKEEVGTTCAHESPLGTATAARPPIAGGSVANLNLHSFFGSVARGHVESIPTASELGARGGGYCNKSS